jgi:omega-hydroxy-beta-dihydromenaquinone-9 sulfotransferase
MMVTVFAKSLRRHFKWWLASLWPGCHPSAPLSLRRMLFLLPGYPLFLGLQLLHWIGFLCDELFFADYRRIKVRDPVFVLGIPRSGTTFLHRTLATDQEQFTSLSTWEATLAPSITERKLISSLAAADRAIGAPFKRLLDRLLRGTTGGFNNIHAVELRAPEEDYLCLLPTGSCFILLLAFPFASELRQLAHLHEMPEAERDQLMQFYQRLLQRHLYAHPGKRLLSKNAAFTTWGPALQSTFPEAKFLVCLREPVSALSSQLSALAPARRAFGTDPDGSTTAACFSEIYAGGYAALARFVASCPSEQTALIAQADLKAAPTPTIQAALEQIGVTPSPATQQSLAGLLPAPPSNHQHRPEDFPMNMQQIRDCMQPEYEAMLRAENRVLNR